ncbi:transporter substrate-binding domain-containing protein [Nocardia stercoris]|nr:transporter substrate-binding domain-containing protein [Nocardia stercoris]
MKRAYLLVIASLAVATAGCGTPGKSEPPLVKIGVAYDQPGLSVMGSDGTPHGFDADTAQYIAGELGVPAGRIQWKEALPAQRESMLSSGAVDFVVSSYSITADHEQHVTFGGPYLVTGQDLLVQAADTMIDRPETLDGHTVCTATGSSDAETIKRDFASGAKFTTGATLTTCVDDLLAGHVDAVSADGAVLAGYAAAHRGQLRVVGRPFTRERYGVGVKKGATELAAAITGTIQAMIADGSWQRSVTVNLPGYQTLPPPPVFLAAAAPKPPADPDALDPELTAAVDGIATAFNTRDWAGLDQLVCADAQDAVEKVISQYTPEYDQTYGPEVAGASFALAVRAVSQSGPTSATFQAHETFTGVPEKYRQYFSDIDYTGTMARGGDNTWKLCGLAADFDQATS